MRSLIFGAIMSVVCAAPVWAQNETTTPLCHHAGLTYSPGAMVRMGRVLVQCAVADLSIGTWIAIDEDNNQQASANCVSGGREFSQGTVQVFGELSTKCSGGIWYSNE